MDIFLLDREEKHVSSNVHNTLILEIIKYYKNKYTSLSSVKSNYFCSFKKNTPWVTNVTRLTLS